MAATPTERTSGMNPKHAIAQVSMKCSICGDTERGPWIVEPTTQEVTCENCEANYQAIVASQQAYEGAAKELDKAVDAVIMALLIMQESGHGTGCECGVCFDLWQAGKLISMSRTEARKQAQ